MRRALLTALAALTLAPAAHADGPGMFSITPARRDVMGDTPARLTPTTVGNSTAQTYRVRVFAVLLHQTLEGPFDFSELPGPLRDASNVLSVSPSQFTLKAHSQRKVRVRWVGLPRGAKQLPVGIVFEGTPPSESGAPVRAVTRLLSLNFLRTAAAGLPHGAVTRVFAQPDPLRERHIDVVAQVANRGGSVGTPCRAVARVRNAAGKVVQHVRFRGDVVVPGAKREFVVPVRGVLPKGDYRVAVSMCFGRHRHGGKRLHATGRFRLVAPGLLPSPGLTLRAFNAQGAPGGTAHARGTLFSSGTAPAHGRVLVQLWKRHGVVPDPTPLKSVRVDLGTLQAGASHGVAVALGGVQPGEYRATATYRGADGHRVVATSDFTPVATRSDWSRFTGWVKHNAGWLLAAVLAAELARRRLTRTSAVP